MPLLSEAVYWLRAASPPASNLAARVLIDIVEHFNQQGLCYPSRATLADHVGASERTVQRALSELLDHVKAPLSRSYRGPGQAAVYAATPALRRAHRGDRIDSPPGVPSVRGGETELTPGGDRIDSPKTGRGGDRSVSRGETKLTRGGDKSVIAIRKNLSKNLSKELLRARGREARVSDDDLDWTARTPEETWALVAEAMKGLVASRHVWATWVRPCRGLRVRAGRLEVATPSREHAGYMGQLAEQLRQAARAADLGELEFTFVVRRVAA